MELKNAQSEGDISTNIQLGIFIPQVVTVQKETKKKGEIQAPVVRKKKELLTGGENGMTEHGVKNVEKTSRKRAMRTEEMEDCLDGHLKKHKVSTTEHISLEEDERKQRRARKTRVRRLKRAKRKQNQADPQPSNTGMDRETALEYLRQWESDRSKWAFRKKSQYWLLQNACNKSQIPKGDFKIFLRYIDGLQGNQRQVSVARMQDVVDRYQHAEDGDDEAVENSSSINKRMYKRAVAILRVLA